jgi:hypothetical protein
MSQPNEVDHPRLVIDVLPPQPGSDTPTVQMQHANIGGGWFAVLRLLITAQEMALNAAMEALEKSRSEVQKPPLVYIPGFNGKN